MPPGIPVPKPRNGPNPAGLRRRAAALACGALLLFIPSPVHACRYNVRDVGFVDLETVPYHLEVFVNRSTPPGAASRLSDLAARALKDANVTLEWVDTDEQPGHPALARRAAATPPTPADTPPPDAILVPPDGPNPPLALSLAWSAAGLGSAAGIEPALAAVATSPTREAIVAATSHAFGTILLIEGTDPSANARARETIAAAIEQIRGHMKSLPKAIAEPPTTIALAPAEFAREQILLWALRQTTVPMAEPRAAILYGRARWIGPIMHGAEISTRNLVGVFSLVGADCECGLDLAWTQGTRLPVRWPESLHAPLAKALGFDPENPVVKTEISWIVSRRGSTPGAEAATPAPAPAPATIPPIPATPGISTPDAPDAPASPLAAESPAATAQHRATWGLVGVALALGILGAGSAIVWRSNRRR